MVRVCMKVNSVSDTSGMNENKGGQNEPQTLATIGLLRPVPLSAAKERPVCDEFDEIVFRTILWRANSL